MHHIGRTISERLRQAGDDLGPKQTGIPIRISPRLDTKTKALASHAAQPYHLLLCRLEMSSKVENDSHKASAKAVVSCKQRLSEQEAGAAHSERLSLRYSL
jgi:hypothetical protein